MTKTLGQYRSTRIERLLLMVTIAMVPQQSNLPKPGGFSLLFILFGFLIFYQVACRPGIFLRTARHSVFVAAYIFVGVALIIEILHGNAAYNEIFRIVFMLVGGIVIASLCRDRKALLYGMYGYVAGSVVLSGLLFATTYGKFGSLSSSGSFHDVSFQRVQLFANNPLQDNLNTMSFFAAQGAIVAMVLTLTAKTSFGRYASLILSLSCIAGTLMPLSRSGVMILVLGFGAVLWVYGIMNFRVITMAAILGLVVMAWVPDAVFSRFRLTSEKHQSGEFQDSRTHVYAAVVKRIPEYVLFGVGMGRFYNEWGKQNEFRTPGGAVVGSHNCLAQVTINWGLIGLATFLMFIWRAYRCIPHRWGKDRLHLCLLGLAVSVMGWSMLMHDLQAKEFSLALGLLIATDLWMRSQGLSRSYQSQDELREASVMGMQLSTMREN